MVGVKNATEIVKSINVLIAMEWEKEHRDSLPLCEHTFSRNSHLNSSENKGGGETRVSLVDSVVDFFMKSINYVP